MKVKQTNKGESVKFAPEKWWVIDITNMNDEQNMEQIVMVHF